jgi:hypothetical protein
MAASAWLRRLVVSIGIGGASYAILLGIMVLSVVYDRELEPVVTLPSIRGAASSMRLTLSCPEAIGARWRRTTCGNG